MSTHEPLLKIRALPDFWESPTLDELAQIQNIQPAPNVLALFGTWPGDDDDGFESAVDNLRHRTTGVVGL